MPEHDPPIRILLADDHGILRAGLRMLLNAEADMDVVGEAEDSAEALWMAESAHPDMVILDLSMPGVGGIEVTRQLSAAYPTLRILILTVHEDQALLREALSAGAAGYILKRASAAELIIAVRTVHRGNLYVHPIMATALLHTLIPKTAPQAGSLETLTPREIEILRHIALGYTNRQIADALHISIRTVETHRAHLMAKLQLNDRAALVRYTREHGLLADAVTRPT
jgi:two-component system, NarL family, response regulator NreC